MARVGYKEDGYVRKRETGIGDRKKTNLGCDHVSDEGIEVLKVQVGALILVLDDDPDPLHKCREGDVGGVGLASSAGEQGDEAVSSVDDERSGVAAPRERPRVAVVRQDRHLDRVHVAQDIVLAGVGHELGERADGGEGSESAFDDTADGLPPEVLAVGVVNVSGGEHIPQWKEAFRGILELRGDVDSVIRESLELLAGDLGAC
jgi:hypothetical protein